MKVINLWAGPGSGKSTTAAGLFFLMKTHGYKVELVTEVAKDFTWQKDFTSLDNSMYISSLQEFRLYRIKDEMDFAITDCPLPMCYTYAKGHYKNDVLEEAILEMYYAYDNVSFYINRVKPYVEEGRNQTYLQARKKDVYIKQYMDAIRESYISVDGNGLAPERIMKQLNLIKHKGDESYEGLRQGTFQHWRHDKRNRKSG